MSEPPWEQWQGWRILDADGNVIESGAPVEIEEDFGLPAEENMNV